MTDRVREVLGALGEELDRRCGTRLRWRAWDPTCGEPSVEQLGPERRSDDSDTLWLYCSVPTERGIVVQRRNGAIAWLVDDGRGLVEEGSARGPTELLDRLWSVAIEMLVDPTAVVASILERAVSRPRLAAFEAVAPARTATRVGWGPLTATLVPGRSDPFPFVELHRGGLVVAGAVERVYARRLVRAGELGRTVAGVMLDYAQQVVGDRPLRGAEPQLAPLDQSVVDWNSWRPGDPPAALRDAIGRRQVEVSDEWRGRLEQLVASESPTAAARRRKLSADRMTAKVVYLPVGNPTGQATTSWGSQSGGARLPVETATIAGLYLLGLGVRAISELLVGDASVKSAIFRRVKEIRGEDGSGEAHPPAAVVAGQRLTQWLPDGPTVEAPPADVSPPSRIMVRRRDEPQAPPADVPATRIIVRRRRGSSEVPPSEAQHDPPARIHMGTWRRIDEELRAVLRQAPLAVLWHGASEPGVIVIQRGLSSCRVERDGTINRGRVSERSMAQSLGGESPDAIEWGVQAILEALIDEKLLVWDEVPLTHRPDTWWDAQASAEA